MVHVCPSFEFHIVISLNETVISRLVALFVLWILELKSSNQRPSVFLKSR